MAGEGELDLEVEFPKFLADILDKTEIIFENLTQKLQKRTPKFLIKPLVCLGK